MKLYLGMELVKDKKINNELHQLHKDIITISREHDMVMEGNRPSRKCSGTRRLLYEFLEKRESIKLCSLWK